MSGKVNLTTGKIIGVEKGSFGYFHEEGHLIYNNSESGMRNGIFQKYFFDFSILILIASIYLRPLSLFSLLLFMGYIGFDYYEELWCDNYARMKIQKRGNKK